MNDIDRLDIIEVSDESGDPMFLKVERYFYYNGEEYVLLRQVDSQTDEAQGQGDERLYVMAVSVSLDDDGEELEEFEPIEPELMEALIKTVQITFHHDLGEEDSNPI